MDPSVLADPNLLESLSKSTPEERAKFFETLEQLQQLPALVEKMRMETIARALLIKKALFFGSLFIVASVFGKQKYGRQKRQKQTQE